MLSYVESFHHAQRSFLNKRQQEAALLLNQACRCIRTTIVYRRTDEGKEVSSRAESPHTRFAKIRLGLSTTIILVSWRGLFIVALSSYTDDNPRGIPRPASLEARSTV
ncbi:hypothetical protein L208DRAFT_1415175 [Tricholoma matsutake]|nr:hypothetical protein L208DRAFT_1415175 [Tricholoma matsutake 945]